MSVVAWAAVAYGVIGWVICFRIALRCFASDGDLDAVTFFLVLLLAALYGLLGAAIWLPFVLVRSWDQNGADWDGIARRIGGEHPTDKRRRLAREAEDRERYIESLERQLEQN